MSLGAGPAPSLRRLPRDRPLAGRCPRETGPLLLPPPLQTPGSEDGKGKACASRRGRNEGKQRRLDLSLVLWQLV